MGSLNCSCFDVSQTKDQKRSQSEIVDNERVQKTFRLIDVVGNCSCLLDGKTKVFDNISLSTESNELHLDEKYQKEFDRKLSQHKGKLHPYTYLRKVVIL